jgi:putative DNA primase/helicase
LIPFEVTIPEDERDPKLLEKLCDEAEGILAWAVEGCMKWRRHGLGMPPAVKKATDFYRTEMDKIAQFLEECCENGVNFSVTNQDLYHAFSEWCSQNGEQVVSKKFLTQRLKEMGYESGTKIGLQKQRGIKGLMLLPTDLA